MPMVATSEAERIGTGTVAIELRCTEFTIRKAIKQGVLTPARFGRYYTFGRDELPAIRRKLLDAGLLKEVAGAR
jgi:hypothetical protein